MLPEVYSKRSYLKISLTSVMAALSIVLSFIQIPFPLTPFLKYDLAGIPLIVIALIIGPKYALIADTLLFIVLLRGGDPIGAFMKWVAEASTFIPMYYAFTTARRLGLSTGKAYAASSTTAVVSRVGLMVLANYLIDPWWLLIAHWASTYGKALALTIYLLPMVAIFNLTLAAIYVTITYPAYTTVVKRFRWLTNANGE